MANKLRNIREEKCPSCGKEKVFISKGNVLLFKIPQMNEKCSNCQYRYEKEPGYFTGAMFISYALCIVEIGFAFLILRLIGIESSFLIYALSFIVIACLTFNFRMSRIIWMYLV